MNRVMVFSVGSKKVVYDVSDQEKFARACVRFMEDKMRRGFFAEPTPPVEFKMTHPQANKIEQEPLREFAKHLISKYKSDLIEYKELEERYQSASQAVNDGDGEACYAIMEQERFKEGMGFDIYEVEQP